MSPETIFACVQDTATKQDWTPPFFEHTCDDRKLSQAVATRVESDSHKLCAPSTCTLAANTHNHIPRNLNLQQSPGVNHSCSLSFRLSLFFFFLFSYFFFCPSGIHLHPHKRRSAVVNSQKSPSDLSLDSHRRRSSTTGTAPAQGPCATFPAVCIHHRPSSLK